LQAVGDQSQRESWQPGDADQKRFRHGHDSSLCSLPRCDAARGQIHPEPPCTLSPGDRLTLPIRPSKYTLATQRRDFRRSSHARAGPRRTQPPGRCKRLVHAPLLERRPPTGEGTRSVPRRRPVALAGRLRQGTDAHKHSGQSSSSACTCSRSLGRVRALFLCQSHVVRQNPERLLHGCAPTGRAAAAPASACIISDGASPTNTARAPKHGAQSMERRAWSAWQPSLPTAPTASTRFPEACPVRTSPALTAASQFERMSAHRSPRRRVRRARAPCFQKTTPFTLIFRACLLGPVFAGQREASPRHPAFTLCIAVSSARHVAEASALPCMPSLARRYVPNGTAAMNAATAHENTHVRMYGWYSLDL
jgi:hypothetical protein